MKDQSHQLNNALTKIKIIYDLMKDSPEESDEHLKSLEKELRKVKDIFYSLRCNS